MSLDDKSRFSAITECGMIKSNYSYNGTYAFITHCGGACVYIYDSKRGKNHKYKLFSRSWYPDNEVLDIDFNRGFLLFVTESFDSALNEFFRLSKMLLEFMINNHDFSPIDINRTLYLFQNDSVQSHV